MEFEFDSNKSKSNSDKHGVDFVRAQGVWLDPSRVEIPARTFDEPRWLMIGRINGRYWSVVFTRRQDNIRIISARRSRTEEVAIYEG